MNMDNGYYKTKDLAEAGALILMKQNFSGIERNEKICWFIFSDKTECQKISNQFFFGKLLVNAKDYYQTLTVLKHKIFNR